MGQLAALITTLLLMALPGMAAAATVKLGDPARGLPGPRDIAIYRGTADQFGFLQDQVVGGGPIQMVNMARFRPDDWRYATFLAVFQRLDDPDPALLNARYDDDPATMLYRVVGNAGHDAFRPFVWLYISAPVVNLSSLPTQAAPAPVPLPATGGLLLPALGGLLLAGRAGCRRISGPDDG